MRRGRALVGVLVVCCAALTAPAHSGSVLDLEDVEAYVADRVATATGAEWKAFRALGRILDRPTRRGLVTDLAKLEAVLRERDRHLAGDGELRELLDDAMRRAHALVTGEAQDLHVTLALLERLKERAAVGRLRAAAQRAVDRIPGAASDPQTVAAYRLAASRLAAGEALASRLLTKQARRDPPGQPLRSGPSGTIATYAGTGAQGFGQDGAPARATSFYFPFDVAVEPTTGLVLVVDSNTHRVRRIDADGRVRTLAGSGVLGDSEGPARDARLHHPSSIAFDAASGDALICGWHAARILRLADGEISYAAGTGELGFSGDGGPATSAALDYPSNAVFLADGSWLVADAGNLRIRRVAADGTITTIAGNGARGAAGDGGDAADATFDFPPGEAEGPVGRIALDPTERFLYVADTANHRVRRIDLADGTIDSFAGDGDARWAGDGGDRLAASFISPVDVDCDGAGNVFVCDRESCTVRRIDVVSGVVTTVAGSGVAGYAGDGWPAAEAKLDAPQGIHVDRVRGRVYVADTFNSVVRVVWE